MKSELKTILDNKFLENMHDAVFILDEQYNIVDCNFTATQWYGYEKPQLIGKSLQDIRAPETRDKISDQMQRVLSDNGGIWETIHLRKGGSKFHVEVSCTPIIVDMNKRFYHVVRDITDRKKMEQASLWIEAIVNSSDDAIISKDLNDIIVSWNKGAERLYGYTEQEAIGKPIKIIIPEDKIDDISMTAKLIESHKFVEHLETVRIAKNGKRIDVSISVSPIINSKGVLIGSSAIARDITERHKNEEALHLSEERYRKIVELSPDAMFIYRNSELIFINPAGVKLFGADQASELLGTSIWKLYKPEKHGIVRARNQAMNNTKQPVPPIENTIITLDSKPIDVEESACPITYDNQAAIYVLMRNIVERKKNRTLLSMQYAIAQNLIDSSNLIDATTNILKIICTNLKFEMARVWVVNGTGNILSPIAIYASDINLEKSAESNSKQINLQIGEGLPGKVWETEEPFWAENVTELIDSDYLPDSDLKLGIGIPMLNEKEVIGVIEIMGLKPMTKDESYILALCGAANQLGSFIKRKLFEKELVYVSKHDAITGLFNRFFFEEMLTFELYRAKSKDQRLAVLFLDIANFSTINQSMGHAAGDELLMLVADRLATLAPNNDDLARFAIDQFVIIINEFYRLDEITDFINRLNLAMSEPFTIQGQKLNIKFNIGVSRFPEDGDNVAALIRGADIALSNAKKSGQGSFEFCNNNISAIAKKRISIETELHEALLNQEFLLHYQPIVETPSLIIKGFESLIRWNKNGKLISPAEFVTIIEGTHLIIPIGEWILRTACLQAKRWQETMGRPIIISVNISPIQFMHANIFEQISNVLKETGLDPTSLKLEITESAIMGDTNKSLKLLNKIKNLGVKLAIDDFGTGYSSLSYLKQLPIDYLKIDQSFVKNMLTNPNNAALVKTIIDLAHNLGYSLIAEGIETEEQLKYINQLGCNEIQGYYFSRPLPADEATEFLKIGCS